MIFGAFLLFSFIFLLCDFSIALCASEILYFPPIPDDFGGMDNVSFSFVDFNLEIDGAEAVQTGAEAVQGLLLLLEL